MNHGDGPISMRKELGDSAIMEKDVHSKGYAIIENLSICNNDKDVILAVASSHNVNGSIDYWCK